MLAGTIYAVLYKFFDFREPLWLFRVGYVDLFMWVATFTVTLVLGVKQGMVAGMAVSALTLVQRYVGVAGYARILGGEGECTIFRMYWPQENVVEPAKLSPPLTRLCRSSDP